MGDTQHAQFKPLKTFTARQLQEADIPPLNFIVDSILPEGLSLLIAPPKYGKSWFSMQLCMAVARGVPLLGFPTVQSSVLYLALEDGARRLQDRQEAFLDGETAPDNFYMAIASESIGSGLEAQLAEFVEKVPDVRLIVVDVLAKIRPAAGKSTQNAYYSDYNDMAPLKRIADKYHICVLVLHHYRKAQDDTDFLNNASGSNGIAGSADTIIGINKPSREADTAMLMITGRDVQMQSIPIAFDSDSRNWVRTVAASPDILRPVVVMVQHVMQDRDEWTGTAAQMLAECSDCLSTRLVTDPRSIGKSLPGLRAEINAHGIDWEQVRGSKGRVYHFFRIGREAIEDQEE